MSDVLIKIDSAVLQGVAKMLALVPKGMATAMPRAINRTLIHTRTVSVKKLREVLALKTDAIRSRMKTVNATRSKWSGLLRIDDKRLSLMRFSVNDLSASGGGISYRIEKFGGRAKNPHAFIAKGRGGTVGAFQRVKFKGLSLRKKIALRGKFSRASGLVPRYPIMMLRGPSLGYFMEAEGVSIRYIEDDGLKWMEIQLDQQVDYLLNKAAAAKTAAAGGTA